MRQTFHRALPTWHRILPPAQRMYLHAQSRMPPRSPQEHSISWAYPRARRGNQAQAPRPKSGDAECVVNAGFTDATLFLPFHFVNRPIHIYFVIKTHNSPKSSFLPLQTHVYPKPRQDFSRLGRKNASDDRCTHHRATQNTNPQFHLVGLWLLPAALPQWRQRSQRSQTHTVVRGPLPYREKRPYI